MPTEEYKNHLSAAMVALVVERLKALADESRVRILLRLKEGAATVGELSRDLRIAQPSVSKHLAILKNVGLLGCTRQGASASYFVRDESIFDLCSIVCAGVSRFVQEQHAAVTSQEGGVE